MPVPAIRRFRHVSGCLLAALAVGMSGCAMCCAPFDYDYPYTGGAWVRDIPDRGRVGSVIDPAGYKAIPDKPESPGNEAGVDDYNEPPAIENLHPESLPAPSNNGQMISTPRLRPVRNYLPQN